MLWGIWYYHIKWREMWYLTSIIQKYTVIPPSSMVLFRIYLLSLVSLFMITFWNMFVSNLNCIFPHWRSWGWGLEEIIYLCGRSVRARQLPGTPLPLLSAHHQINLKSNQISTAKKGQPKNQTKYYYYCKEMTTLKSNQISSAHANSQRIEHPLKSNQALNPGNGKNKQNWSSRKLYCTLWNFKAYRLCLRP